MNHDDAEARTSGVPDPKGGLSVTGAGRLDTGPWETSTPPGTSARSPVDHPGGAGSTHAPGPGERPATVRDPFYDNTKFLLVTLVVIGHGWGSLTQDHPALHAVYLFVYSFHMPAFILISGYFSRNFDSSPARVKRLITSLVIPYVIFETTYELIFDALNGDPLRISLLNPSYATWFLIALFFWRMTGSVWRALRWPIPVAFAVSLLAGTTQLNQTMSIARVLQFLPWFVVGMFLRPEHFRMLHRPLVRWASAAGALVCFAGVALGSRLGLSSAPFLNTKGYQQLGLDLVEWVPLRLAMFVVAGTMTVAVLAWTPRRVTWFTTFGTGTLYTYLLHVGVIRALRGLGFFELDLFTTYVGLALWTVALVGLSVLLSSSPVRRLFRCVVEPRLEWLFAPMTPRQTPPPPPRQATAGTRSVTLDLRDEVIGRESPEHAGTSSRKEGPATTP